MSERLIDLAAGWRMWRLVALRSAGLPFDVLAPLATSGTGRPALTELLANDTFRTALTWQNPEVIDNWVDRYAEELRAGSPPPRLSEADRREALIARYAQRYCAKNDTIGHFGPVAWARWGSGPTRRSGMFGTRRAKVYLETWAIEALAHRWNADPALFDHLPVGLNPSCTVVDDLLHRPHEPALRLDAETARIVALLADVDRVGDLRALAGPAVVDVLARLDKDRAVRIGFFVPLDSHPEHHLREQVEKISDAALRGRLVAVLDDVAAAVAAVPTGVDTPSLLRKALGGVDAALADAVGASVRPGPGRAPGGRTPTYVDTRRDLDVVLGDALREDLAEPLGVLLDSARWLAGQVGEVVEAGLRQRFTELRGRRGEVTLGDLQFVAADLLDQNGDGLAAVRTDFQLRWQEILPRDGGVVSAQSARRLADALFPRTGLMWAAARSHSPDLMVRDVPDGEPRWVLGELHVGLNTLENRFFRTQADDPAELTRTLAEDVAEGRVVPVYPNTAREVSSRGYPPLCLDPPGRYRYWSYGADHGAPNGAASTPAAALLVSEQDGRLIASAAAHSWAAPVIECFGEFLSAVVVNMFRLRPAASYAPRVAVDGLVVCRRTWCVPFTEFEPIPTRARDPHHDHLRRVAENLGLPRHVFVRALSGAKPFYVDFASPALVDNLARAVRRASARVRGGYVEVVEMLPAPEELWLCDDAGRRYTSELRTVAVDPTRHPPASWSLP